MKTTLEVLSGFTHLPIGDLNRDSFIIQPKEALRAMESYASQFQSKVEQKSAENEGEQFVEGLLNKIDSQIARLQGKPMSEDEMDLIQYVTNLLYYAVKQMPTQKFDEWVELEMENLRSYYAKQLKDRR